MALDDASPQAFDPSDNPVTQHSDSTTSWTKYHIKPELINHPDLFTLYFGFFGTWNWRRKLLQNLSQRIENARVLVQRPPTQEELDAFVQHTSLSIYQQRIGAPLGFLSGSAWLATQARKSEKYPVYMGRQAGGPVTLRQIWQGVRAFASAEPLAFRQVGAVSAFKLLFWTVGASAITSFYAIWVDTTTTMADPRLRQFVADVRNQDPEEVRKRKMEASVDRTKARMRQRQRQREMEVEMRTSSSSGQEDGFEQEAEQEQGSGGGSDGALYSNPDTSSAGSGSERQAVGRWSAEDRDRGVDFFDNEDDDASPTAPEYRAVTRQQGAGAATGSAWERIRQQSQAQSPSQPAILKPSSRPQQANWDSWGTSASSSAGNDSQQEKEQAQAAFDRLLESERDISTDSSETTGQRRGWKKWD